MGSWGLGGGGEEGTDSGAVSELTTGGGGAAAGGGELGGGVSERGGAAAGGGDSEGTGTAGSPPGADEEGTGSVAGGSGGVVSEASGGGTDRVAAEDSGVTSPAGDDEPSDPVIGPSGLPVLSPLSAGAGAPPRLPSHQAPPATATSSIRPRATTRARPQEREPRVAYVPVPTGWDAMASVGKGCDGRAPAWFGGG